MIENDGNYQDFLAFVASAISAGVRPRIIDSESIAVRFLVSDGVEERWFRMLYRDLTSSQSVDFHSP